MLSSTDNLVLCPIWCENTSYLVIDFFFGKVGGKYGSVTNMPKLILLYHKFTTSINYDIDIDTKSDLSTSGIEQGV